MKRLFWAIVIAIAVGALVVALASCDLWQSREAATGSETQTRTYRESGTTEAGTPFSKQGSEEVRTERESTTEKKSGIDDAALQKAIQVGLASVTGDIASMKSAITAIPKPFTGSPTADQAITMLITYLGAKSGLAGVAKLRNKKAA